MKNSLVPGNDEFQVHMFSNRAWSVCGWERVWVGGWVDEGWQAVPFLPFEPLPHMMLMFLHRPGETLNDKELELIALSERLNNRMSTSSISALVQIFSLEERLPFEQKWNDSKQTSVWHLYCPSNQFILSSALVIEGTLRSMSLLVTRLLCS